MPHAPRSIRILSASCALMFSGVLGAAAQQPSTAGKTAERVYKNIKVLQGTPADDLDANMHLISGDLGVSCTFCHLDDRTKDDLEAKQTARKMITMVQELNKSSFDGKPEVTCYTCHRGNADPVADLPLDIPVLPAGDEPAKPKGPALPTADQLISKYVQAIGGEQALRKVTSRVITGTQTVPVGVHGRSSVPTLVQIYQKAPYLVVDVYQPPTPKPQLQYPLSDGFDGTVGWFQLSTGRVVEADGIGAPRAKRIADFYAPLNFKQEYKRLTTTGQDKVNNHDVYVVTGIPQNGGGPDHFYFDMQTGLLIRTVTLEPAPIGNSAARVDYDDYRDTGSGVRMPYQIQMKPASPLSAIGSEASLHIDKVQENVPIDNGKFTKPQSTRPAPAQ